MSRVWSMRFAAHLAGSAEETWMMKYLPFAGSPLALKVMVRGDAVEVLQGADGLAHVGAGGQLAAVGLGGVLDGLEQDGGAVIGLGGEGLRVVAELGLEVGDELGGVGIGGGRAGHGGEVGAGALEQGVAADLGGVGGVEAVVGQAHALEALLPGLLVEHRGLVEHAAEVDALGLGGDDRG